MLRTQISLTSEDRQLLDEVAARTGQSISALIRQAVEATYGSRPSLDDDLAAMQEAFGSWHDRRQDGADWVDGVRSGKRLHERAG